MVSFWRTRPAQTDAGRVRRTERADGDARGCRGSAGRRAGVDRKPVSRAHSPARLLRFTIGIRMASTISSTIPPITSSTPARPGRRGPRPAARAPAPDPGPRVPARGPACPICSPRRDDGQQQGREDVGLGHGAAQATTLAHAGGDEQGALAGEAVGGHGGRGLQRLDQGHVGADQGGQRLRRTGRRSDAGRSRRRAGSSAGTRRSGGALAGTASQRFQATPATTPRSAHRRRRSGRRPIRAIRARVRKGSSAPRETNTFTMSGTT